MSFALYVLTIKPSHLDELLGLAGASWTGGMCRTSTPCSLASLDQTRHRDALACQHSSEVITNCEQMFAVHLSEAMCLGPSRNLVDSITNSAH